MAVANKLNVFIAFRNRLDMIVSSPYSDGRVDELLEEVYQMGMIEAPTKCGFCGEVGTINDDMDCMHCGGRDVELTY